MTAKNGPKPVNLDQLPATFARSRSSPHSMDVVLDGTGHCEVDHLKYDIFHLFNYAKK